MAMGDFLFAVFALLAGLGLIFGCGVVVAWMRGEFAQSKVQHSDQISAYQRGIDIYDPARDLARHEALVRIEERELMRGDETGSALENAIEASTAPPEVSERFSAPLVGAHEAEREAARDAALARIAARAAVDAHDVIDEVAQREAAAKVREEIERRAAKAEKAKPRPGVRTVHEYDFDKPLRDDLPRSGMTDDPLDHLPGYR